MDEKDIERIECHLLDILTQIFDDKYTELQEHVNETDIFKPYLLPTVFASSSFSTFNIYDEILEKYAGIIIREQFPDKFEPRPLSVSSDLCFESKDCILHIDIKTANTSNQSDYESCVPVGTNQTTYSGEINKFKRSYESAPGFKVYPSLPTEYTINSKDKITVTLAVQVIYESYTDELNAVVDVWEKARSEVKNSLFNSVDKFYTPEVAESIYTYLERSNRIETVSDNILLKELVDPFEDFCVVEDNRGIIQGLKNVVSESSVSCKVNSVKCIAVPNGELEPMYDSSMRSGKKWGDSIRYYHTEGNGEFRLLSGNLDRVRYVC